MSTACGSSPLTRGAPRKSAGRMDVERIIPAHAGSTRTGPAGIRGTSDHPRSRGEHSMRSNPSHGGSGSSPLTRGAPVTGAAHGLCAGIIPAHAGSTMDPFTSGACGGDHPRSRGEHALIWKSPQVPPGSSPLTRGARRRRASRCAHRRIIPAHAGSTTESSSWSR